MNASTTLSTTRQTAEPMAKHSNIALCTINARYNHASLGLRYLLANLAELRDQAILLEFTQQKSTSDMLETLLSHRPKVVGFGVYIWNIEQTTELVQQLKRVAPEIIVVLGGPEVSYEWQEQTIVQEADYLITGPADLAFASLCRTLLSEQPPSEKVIHAAQAPLASIELPMQEFSEEDLAKRYLYLEASRGCPFKCEFCLSSLDKTAWPFATERVLDMLDHYYQRGARHFKFVDRTFNLRMETCSAILQFFLQRLDPSLFLHFELIPDRLPAALKPLLVQFPPGSLQFEIGIQSFNPEVQARISRRQDDQKTAENLHWLRQHTQIHLHTDLIAGLPGEDLASFAAGFNKLDAFAPQEIQLGILKRLRGTPISRHEAAYELVFSPTAPYEVLKTRDLSFVEIQGLKRLAKYWDLIANSGHFNHSLPLLKGDNTFWRFWQLSQNLGRKLGPGHSIGLPRLIDAIATLHVGSEEQTILFEALRADCQDAGLKRLPDILGGQSLTQRPATASAPVHNKRQRRHLGRAG